MHLTDLFDLSFAGRRDAIALEFEAGSLTFGEIDERSNRVARLFAHRGLAAGDRLCVYLANCVEMIDLYLACVKLGVIFVPINILYKEREIAHIVADAEPKALVAAAETLCARGADGLAVCPVWNPQEISTAAALFPATRPPIALDGDAPAAIV